MSFVYIPTSDEAEVIHADHQVLVVNKPSGLLSVPGRGDDSAATHEAVRADQSGLTMASTAWHRFRMTSPGSPKHARSRMSGTAARSIAITDSQIAPGHHGRNR